MLPKIAIVVLALVAFVIFAQRRHARKRDALWAAFAQAIPGLTFTPGKGLFARRRIAGVVKGHTFEMRGAFGSVSRRRVRLTPRVILEVRLSGVGGERLSLRRRRAADRFAGRTIEVGDDIMDTQWWLAAIPSEFGRNLFATRISLRHRVAFLNNIEIALADGLLRVTKPAPPLTVGYLGILLEFALDLAAAIEEESPR